MAPKQLLKSFSRMLKRSASPTVVAWLASLAVQTVKRTSFLALATTTASNDETTPTPASAPTTARDRSVILTTPSSHPSPPPSSYIITNLSHLLRETAKPIRIPLIPKAGGVPSAMADRSERNHKQLPASEEDWVKWARESVHQRFAPWA